MERLVVRTVTERGKGREFERPRYGNPAEFRPVGTGDSQGWGRRRGEVGGRRHGAETAGHFFLRTGWLRLDSPGFTWIHLDSPGFASAAPAFRVRPPPILPPGEIGSSRIEPERPLSGSHRMRPSPSGSWSLPHIASHAPSSVPCTQASQSAPLDTAPRATAPHYHQSQIVGHPPLHRMARRSQSSCIISQRGDDHARRHARQGRHQLRGPR
jgi:hypothetical protein